MSQPNFHWSHFEKIIKHLKEGKLDLPNPTPVDLPRAVSNATLGSRPAEKGRVKASYSEWATWGLWFINMTQGGQYDGTGMVFVYGNNGGRAFEFAICKHEKVEGPTANPSRGWHPGKCKICGLDMTYDSGD